MRAAEAYGRRVQRDIMTQGRYCMHKNRPDVPGVRFITIYISAAYYCLLSAFATLSVLSVLSEFSELRAFFSFFISQ